MHSRTRTAIAAVAITGLAVVGMDAYTYAGTGDSLLLGKLNKSSKTTHIKSTGNGPALSLHAKDKRPALAVDSKAKIVKLNADRVDGKDARALQNNVRIYSAASGTSTDGELDFALPNFPRGRYQATFYVYMDGTYGHPDDPIFGRCFFETVTGDRVVAGWMTNTSEFENVALSGSDIITKRAAKWRLHCFAIQINASEPKDWQIIHPVRITLTKIDRAIGGQLAVD